MATDQVYATPFPSSGGVPEGRGGLQRRGIKTSRVQKIFIFFKLRRNIL